MVLWSCDLVVDLPVSEAWNSRSILDLTKDRMNGVRGALIVIFYMDKNQHLKGLNGIRLFNERHTLCR